MKYKINIKTYFWAFVLVFNGQWATAQTLDTLTLSELLQLAQEKQIAKSEAVVNARIAALNFAIYQASLKPQIDLNARIPNYSKTFGEVTQPNGSILFQSVTNNNSSLGILMSQQIPKTGGSIYAQTSVQRFDDFENSAKRYNGLPIQLTFFQPLFGFNSMKWNKVIEPLKLRVAEKQYSADLAMINTQSVTLFFNLLIANQDFEIAEANKKSNEQLYEIAEERFDLGKISKSDLMQLKLGLISAEKDKRRAFQSVQLASSDLYIFLGLSADNHIIIPKVPNALEVISIDAKAALEQAKANRPEIENFYKMKIEAAQALEKAKKESGLQANLTASFGFVKSADNLSAVYVNPQQSQFLQLQLSVPILDWGQNATKRTIAEEQLKYTEQKIAQETLLFENNILQIIQKFENAQQELELVKALQQLAQERFEIIQKSYVLGAISVTDFTIAQQEKDFALRDYITTLQLYWQYYYALKLWTL